MFLVRVWLGFGIERRKNARNQELCFCQAAEVVRRFRFQFGNWDPSIQTSVCCAAGLRLHRVKLSLTFVTRYTL
jgi:hypothetical protein